MGPSQILAHVDTKKRLDTVSIVHTWYCVASITYVHNSKFGTRHRYSWYCVPQNRHVRHTSRVVRPSLLLRTKPYHDRNMARTDSFFIRASTDTNGTTYAQSAIDLGAYVDALGKSVLRIHNISVQYGDAMEAYVGAADSSTQSAFQLTTQSQTDMVNIDNRSVIAAGTLAISTGTSSVTAMSSDLDLGPQDWTEGYLIAVEQLYLGVDQTYAHVNRVSIVLECTVETMTQAAAMALALSQQ
jgi:hypothetical protein